MKKTLLLTLMMAAFICTLKAQDILSIEFLESRTKAQLVDEFGPFTRYGAELYRVTYETPDIYGVKDTASGLFVYPVPEDSLEINVYPMLIYQHGTVGSRLDVPSELAGGFQLAMFWASVGYATTAADFLGLGTSRGFHPYVHARTEASAAIDFHIGMKDIASDEGFLVNDQLFVTGYSQGGHGAAAAQQMIQEDYAGQLEVTASAPMSGPYDISGVMRDLMLDDANDYFFVGYAPYSVMSYNLEYDIFTETNEIFKEPIATWAQQFFDEEIDLWEMNDSIIVWLQDNFGISAPRFMFQDSILMQVENDPNHPINQALGDNDLINWGPTAPTRLYYCTADDQVPFMNSVIGKDSMIASGAVDVDAIDVNSVADHGGCVTPAVTNGFIFFNNFQDISLTASELSTNLKFSISPNPASDHINIIFKNGIQEFDRIELINLDGRLLKSSTQQTTIQTSDLAQGIYFIRLSAQDGIWVEKVIIH